MGLPGAAADGGAEKAGEERLTAEQEFVHHKVREKRVSKINAGASHDR